MTIARGGNGRRAVVALNRKHSRFLNDLIETVRGRTGVALDASDVIRVLLDQAIECDFRGVDMDAACAKVQTLSMLLDTRRAVEREIRQTESDLHQTLKHDADGAETVKAFRRNLRYQTDRLGFLDEQANQLCNPNGERQNGAFRLVLALLSACRDGNGKE